MTRLMTPIEQIQNDAWILSARVPWDRFRAAYPEKAREYIKKYRAELSTSYHRTMFDYLVDEHRRTPTAAHCEAKKTAMRLRELVREEEGRPIEV